MAGALAKAMAVTIMVMMRRRRVLVVDVIGDPEDTPEKLSSLNLSPSSSVCCREEGAQCLREQVPGAGSGPQQGRQPHAHIAQAQLGGYVAGAGASRVQRPEPDVSADRRGPGDPGHPDLQPDGHHGHVPQGQHPWARVRPLLLASPGPLGLLPH